MPRNRSVAPPLHTQNDIPWKTWNEWDGRACRLFIYLRKIIINTRNENSS